VGKPHACHQLVEAAQGEVLLFLDADVRLLPGGLDRLLGELDGVGGGPPADLVTAVPRQQTGSPFEHLMLPLLHLSYAAWLPQALVPRTRDPRVLAANGQVLAVRRAADAAAGGFSAVRGAVVDDMAYCRRVKEAGLRVVFADGHEIARCRMYEDAPGVWAGFSKNMYEGIGGHPLALLFVMALHIGCFVTPYLAVAAGLLGAPALLGPGLAGVGANLLLRAVLGLRHGHRAGWALLHPVAVLAMMGILLNSWRWSVRRDIRWRGRSYPGAAGAAPSAPLRRRPRAARPSWCWHVLTATARSPAASTACTCAASRRPGPWRCPGPPSSRPPTSAGGTRCCCSCSTRPSAPSHTR
jgi:hypothetical protein